ncbi:M23 family metallopeptidase [Microbacterium sp. 1P10UB]|uniref:M23 family metallopeptidase n=1 Tax=unclassified Microbacterium TaxID=2609290 RepID=UPI0039A07E50
MTEQFTPILMSVPTTPGWFTGSDGSVHLVYEVALLNAFPVDVTLQKLEVLDGSAVIATLEGDALSAAWSLQPLGVPRPDALPPSTAGVIWMDVVLDEPGDVPDTVDHRLTVSVPPGLPVPEQITSTGGATTAAPTAAVVISPPLEGDGWFAIGSCCDGPHRRAFQPIDNGQYLAQRFAIDFNRLSADDRLATGDPSLNESWPTYDQPVLAVADATVIRAADEFPDQVPDAPEPVTIDEADGNYVILELSDGVFAFYAHLKPGSVDVRVGDTVTAGQEIARTGNSGSSTGPHLHFQVMDRPSALVANGLPYVFDRFDVVGRGPALADLPTADPQGVAITIDTSTAGSRTDELPLGRDILDFAG